MARYAARRLAQAIFVLFGTTALVHVAMFVLPGDPIRPKFGLIRPDPEVLAAERAQWGLDQPWPVQYLRFLGRLLTGDLGRSYRGFDVAEMIRASYPVTLKVVLLAVVIQAFGGISLGLLAAHRPGGFWDRVVSASVLLTLSVPVVVISVVAADGMPWLEWGPRMEEVILPALVLGSVSTALTARLTRFGVREQLHEAYAKVAAVKGLSQQAVVTRHALRNALPTVVAFVGADVAAMASVLPVVEKAFALDGLGTRVVSAARDNDTAPLISLVCIFVVVAVVANLLADLLAAALDPRRRLGQ